MPAHPHNETLPQFQLCLDDEELCRGGPVPVRISSVSGSGLAVLMVSNEAGLIDPADFMVQGEGRPLRLMARIGERTVAVTAQLVWCEVSSASEADLELIVDGTGASEWPLIVAAYRGAA